MRIDSKVWLAAVAVCLWGCQGQRVAAPPEGAASHPAEGAETPPYRIVDGTLGGSVIRIALPGRWNRDVLVFAHGLRAAGSPVTADFSTKDALFTSLIQEGWMVAATSYRRNGYIIKEAIEDIDQLREHIIDTYGMPNRVFVNGDSMGGSIATLMVETREGRYAGMLAVGAAIGLGGKSYTYKPKMPVLLMSNQSEIREPRAYAAKVPPGGVRPACWLVKRDGHCNVTSEEKLAGLRALVKWVDTGAIEMGGDGTIVVPPPPSVAVFADGQAVARVTYCASGRGSFETEFTAADLARLGIPLRSRFTVTCRDKTLVVTYGTSFGDVPRGGWVAYVLAENGRLRIGRNRADAVGVLDCAAGDAITIAPVEPARE